MSRKAAGPPTLSIWWMFAYEKYWLSELEFPVGQKGKYCTGENLPYLV